MLTLLTAMDLTVSAWLTYLPALAAALLCALGSMSGGMAIGMTAVAVLALGVGIGANMDAVSAVRQWIASLTDSGVVPDQERRSGAGAFMLIYHRGGIPFALAIYVAKLILSYALNEDMSFGIAVPGLIAALSALALSGEVPKDAGSWRAILCAVLAVVLALAIVPTDRITWEPLETAAQVVRTVFEDYFQFTEERVPFTISTEGYNYAIEVNGEVEPMLGGPADPDEDAVMVVTADSDVLLRGTIRRTYTGSYWSDTEAKARYLYYDFLRSSVREKVFSMSDNDAFDEVEVSVEFLTTGTSSLFITSRLESFDMDASRALYYNSIGEIFLTDPVEEGDSYSFVGYQVGDEDAVRDAIASASLEDDSYYDEIYEACTQLPDGIEEGVYTLALELTEACDNDYDKAKAIEYWLRENCVYSLTPDYPDSDRDFVSQFVLTDRVGYCSYFASAMTVMCRIAGLPARYVEGYYVRANNGEAVTVTGEDAHAWTEVYFSGIGWVSFNPASGSGGGSEGMDDDEAAVDPIEEETTPSESGVDSYEDDSDSDEDDSQDDSQDDPTPPPEDDTSDLPDDQDEDDSNDDTDLEDDQTPTPPPDAFSDSDPPDDDDDSNIRWLWILLIILLILILLAILCLLIRKRLNATDPIRLSEQAEDAVKASMILYRSILTMLQQTGQAPMSGETPGAFARRVDAQTPNPDFVAFADAVALSAYARAEISEASVDVGRNAYRTFEKGLKRGERLRYMMTRITKGLGEFEIIP